MPAVMAANNRVTNELTVPTVSIDVVCVCMGKTPYNHIKICFIQTAKRYNGVAISAQERVEDSFGFLFNFKLKMNNGVEIRIICIKYDKPVLKFKNRLVDIIEPIK
jgi:hypothetical protein